MVTDKEVVLALLGVSAGAAGLVLVFLGLVVAALSSFPPGTSQTVLAPYKRAGLYVLTAFAIGMVCTALATAWLLAGGDGVLYVLVVVTFFLQLVAAGAAAGYVFYRIVWSE